MNNLLLAFQITAFGMGLVFVVILLLWLMMTLLAALTTKDIAPNPPTDDSVINNDILAEAVATAVAIAIAEQQLSSAHPLADPPTAIVSAWQLGMRTRQMTEKGARHR